MLVVIPKTDLNRERKRGETGFLKTASDIQELKEKTKK